MENSPYKHFHNNTKNELIGDKQSGIIKIEQGIKRSLEDIENGMINDTLELAGIFDGSISKSSHILDGEVMDETPFEEAVYLDKSARPVRKLLHSLWPDISEGAEPRPSFINVDKRPWLKMMGMDDNKEDGTNLEDVDVAEVSLDKIDPTYLHEATTRLRALYLDNESLNSIDEDSLEDVWSLPTVLDGKKVAIIDEVKSSGNTLRIAKELLQKAIPEADFTGLWWSTPKQLSWDTGMKELQKAAEFVPAWYKEDEIDGRGIGDISESYSRRSRSKRQRIGAQILSAPLFDTADPNFSRLPDGPITKKVNSDLKTLAQRYRDKELVDYIPPPNYITDDERQGDYRKWIEGYYGEPMKDALAKRKQRRSK